ncbi:MAG: hypothetical protein ACRBK7_04350 [Acidimicrobiales bacterium]
MEATLTLPQAGDLLGVNDSDLSRLIRIGALPEARKVDGPEGRVWTIAEAHLPAIASRNGWTIDLRDGATETLSAIQEPAPPTAPAELSLVSHQEATPISMATHTNGTVVETDLAVNGRVGDQLEPRVDGDVEPSDAEAGETPRLAESLDLALLDRLLTSHEDRVAAEVKEQEARHALTALADTHNKTTGELAVERRERMAVAERYREERRARAVADAKVAELKDRVAREVALVDSEKEARNLALNRGLRAERDAANAVALLGWRARRRYQKLNEKND